MQCSIDRTIKKTRKLRKDINLQYKYAINSSSNFAREDLLNIETLFNGSKESIHKARNEIKIITINEIPYVVKAFKVPHIINKYAYTFLRSSKAKRSYENSIKLKEFAPKPIAYIEFFENKLLHKSYFISEYYPYDFTMKYPLIDPNFEDRENILRSFADFTFELHQHNIFHIDYSPGNILIKKENGAYNFKIVDVNRMRFCHLSTQQRAQNLSKLTQETQDLKVIAQTYEKHIAPEQNFYPLLLSYVKKHQQRKWRKKYLKKLFHNT